MKTEGARGHARCANPDCGDEMIPSHIWKALPAEERQERRTRKQNRTGGNRMCQRCYVNARHAAAREEGCPQRTITATADLSSLRNVIHPDAPAPAGWVRDPRTGVMRYEGDLDEDYADELEAAGVFPERPGMYAGRRDPELLVRMYVDEQMSIRNVARKVAAREDTVAAILRAAGVTIRPGNQFGRQREVAA